MTNPAAPARRTAAQPPAGLPDNMVQRIVPAANVPNSVFQAGQQAREKRAYARTEIDLSKLQVYADRPLPAATRGGAQGGPSVYEVIFNEKLTKPGMSVDLTLKQARGMVSWAKKAKKKLALRQLGPDLAGVWRLE